YLHRRLPGSCRSIHQRRHPMVRRRPGVRDRKEGPVPKTLIQTTKGASPSGAYSQGLRVGDFVFVSGQGPLDPATGQVVGETIEEQTAQTLENVKAILEAAGATMADVVKSTVHLS